MLGEGYPVRTDLALETQERVVRGGGEIKGVDFSENRMENGITVSTVHILTKNAEKAMGRPRGYYITIEAPDMIDDDEGYHREISKELAKIIRKMLPRKTETGSKPQTEADRNHEQESDTDNGMESGEVSALIVGLGNREVTPDALGPRVIDNMFITRHIINEYGRYAFGDEHVSKISGIVPGVMAQTGMECVEIVRGVVKETHPDFVITVDALAARNAKRLCRTIQLTDTGITPGSGIGNHRHALNQESVGVPVISLGVPTVVDAATIVNDTMYNLIAALNQSRELNSLGSSLESLDDAEKYELIRELLSPSLNTMFVTPKDIDESIKRLSFTISEGINIAFSKTE
jgi:spore protease